MINSLFFQWLMVRKNYFWYNTGTGRDPGVEHLAEQEEFTITYTEESEMLVKEKLCWKVF